MTKSKSIPLLAFACALLGHIFAPSVSAQSGHIKGIVRVASGAPVTGVAVIATNQVTGKWKRARSDNNGKYSFELKPGAYRLRVSHPHVAKFEKETNYGEFAIARGEALENVIVEPGKDVVIDIPLDQVDFKQLPESRRGQPTGHAGDDSVSSQPQTDASRRETRDRW